MIRLKSLLNESATAAPTVMTFLTARGLNLAQAAGIGGNLKQESSFNPKADNNKKSGEFGEKLADGTRAAPKGHFGIAQWDKINRWPKVKKWMKSNNHDPYSLLGQLNALKWEAKERGDWDEILKTTTPEKAAAAWLKHFEISGEKPGQPGYDQRVAYANELYNIFKKTSTTTSKTSQSSATSAWTDAVNAISKLSSNKTYTIKSGDTLSRIANQNKTTVAAIQKANPGINPNQLKIGQKIKLP